MGDADKDSMLLQLPLDIFLEIVKYLRLSEILSLRATSKSLFELTSKRSVWLVAARGIAGRQPLPLPIGRCLRHCSEREMVDALVKAANLRNILRVDGDHHTIHPRGPVKILEDVYGNEDDAVLAPLFLLLPRGGKYVGSISGTYLTCWDVASGRAVAGIDIGSFSMINMKLLSNSESTERLLLAYWQETSLTSDLISGTFTISELRLPSAEAWSSASFVEIFSTPVSMDISSITIDSQFVSATGLLGTGTASVLFVLHTTTEACWLNTQSSPPRGREMHTFISESQLVLYYEADSISHLLMYELRQLLGLVRRGPTPPITLLAPTFMRSMPFVSGPKLLDPPHFVDTKGFQSFLGTSHKVQHSFQGFVTTRLDATDNIWILTCHILDHIFEPDSTSTSHCETYTILATAVASTPYVNHMIWAFDCPYAAYVRVDEEAQWELTLIVFPNGFEDQRGIIKEYAIPLPSCIDLELLYDMDFDDSRGMLALSTTDSHVYIVELL